ncbi:hypothetical protein ONZ43_g3950 [Nemania bipapillata]|uniref:Uncharacterized protein n=1 Tax=Nemania bipapillata TaxID=110536 RepID=A0ACC2ITV5_9PEZI|nr:hypothetical protein ONZ43_g3950 [Nemania bipapillata]
MADDESPNEAEQRTADAMRWIQEANYIPQDEQYEWLPFCEALVDSHRDAQDVLRRPPPPPAPEGGGGGPTNRKDVVFGTDPSRLVPDVGESWNRVLYVPAWMDPDYREEVIETPNMALLRNSVGTRDSLYNLRPALRLSDTIRNPTEYALRFGIADGRLDGRSRMSPTWSRTRDPFDDLANQANMLSDRDRQEALELSRQRYQQMNQAPVPGREILPEVMEQFLTRRGLLSERRPGAELKNAADRGISLDEVLDELEKGNPQIRKAHQVFLDNALDDQDYQRTLLGGLTTDELVMHNLHTMTDDVVVDLDNPIHPMAEYRLMGYKAKNDALWDALQPALRLASMVLSRGPPILEALIDMTTRQPIPPEQDGRENKTTPTLSHYVLQQDVDLSRTYPALRTLEEVYKYDWKSNVFRILSRILVLDIDWAFDLGGQVAQMEDDDVPDDGHQSFVWGSTAIDVKTKIRVRIAGDMMWPLLVPEYSASEKMMVSFAVATTLLHELAPSSLLARRMLGPGDTRDAGLGTTSDSVQDQDPEVTRLLRSLAGELYSKDNIEPYFRDVPVDEVGKDLEYSLWGSAVGLPAAEMKSLRHIIGLKFALGFDTYPDPPNGTRVGAARPMMRYIRPASLGYIGKFFSKRFWADEFEAYGFAALKMWPDGRPQLNLRHVPRKSELSVDSRRHGPYMAAFLRGVPSILSQSRHPVFAEYLGALKLELTYREQMEEWWTKEVENWDRELLYPLHPSIDKFLDDYAKAEVLQELRAAQDQMPYYMQWREDQVDKDQPPRSFDQWRQDAESEWREAFRYGGLLMRELLVVHNEMQNDMGNLQRMVFYYLQTKPPGAEFPLVVRAAEGRVIGKVYSRLNANRLAAENIAASVARIAADPSLVDVRGRWLEWLARFQSTQTEFAEVLSMFVQGCGARSGDFDIPRKARFKRLPTGDWKNPSERYRKLALRDYTRAHPEVRKTIDDFLFQFRNSDPIRSRPVRVGQRGPKPHPQASPP